MIHARNILIPRFRSLRILMTTIVVIGAQLPSWCDTVDSLYLVFTKADRAHKIEIVNKTSAELHNQEITDSLYKCDQVTKETQVDATMHYLMAEHFYDQGEFEEALAHGNKARELTTNHKPDIFISDILGVVSNSQFRLGIYDQAIETLNEAYKLDLALDDKKLISSDLSSLAATYLAIELPQKGLPYINKAIDIERQLARRDRLAIRLGIASELYLMNNEPEKAMAAIDEAYRIDHEDGRAVKAAIRLAQKGAILEATSLFDEARTTIMRALPELEKANVTYSLAVSYNPLGNINHKLGDREASVSYYKKALAQSIKCGSPMTERIAEKGLWETLRDHDPNLALLHLERYSILSDSLMDQRASIESKILELNSDQPGFQGSDNNFFANKKLLRWGVLLFTILILLALTALYHAWLKNRKALKFQKETQDLKSYFFSNIANKLQSPLTVIMSAGYKLAEGGKPNNGENKHIGEMIVSHGKEMLNLVNQLIDIEKVRSSIEKPEIKKEDIVMFVRMLVENFQDEARRKNLNLEFSSPQKSLMVAFPIDPVRKIVNNLVFNAIKFTNQGTVTVEMSQPENNKLRLVVTDTGVGIPTEERNRLFEPFSQANRHENGVNTSTSLTLVYQLVQILNGTIDVDSQLGQGTSFKIEFPAQVLENNFDVGTEEASEFAEKRIRQTNETRQKPLVFIVENNEDVAFFIAGHLKGKYELRIARDGREAYQNAQDMIPDLVITNMVMPVMDGWELIKRLRSNPSLSHIPIIAMTSNINEQERMACFETGADNVLIKPFNSSELRILANNLIKMRSTMREWYVRTGNEISNNDQAPAMSKNDQMFINKLVDVVHAQMLKDDIDMEHIASAMTLSRKQLRTRVMSITGMTPVAYVLQLRLNYARHMIMTQDTSLTTIASKCGFQNLSHFSKAFKQQFGMSPLQFRKNVENVSPTQPL